MHSMPLDAKPMMADNARTHAARGSDRASIFAPGGGRLIRYDPTHDRNKHASERDLSGIR